MADNAQVNLNAIRRIFGARDLIISMLDKERTCLLH